MSKEELRTRIEAELLTGVTAQDLEKKYEVPYVTINGWKKKLLSEGPEVAVSDLTNHTVASLEVIRDVAKSTAPKAAAKIDKLIDGVQGLKELEPEFHTALQKSVRIAQQYLDMTDDEGKSELSIKEWQMITSTLANAYGTLFNKSGTTVNVAQTNVNAAAENLAFFKSSQRAV